MTKRTEPMRLPMSAAWLARELGTAGLEGVGDVFDKDQAKHDVLVFGGVHIGATAIIKMVKTMAIG